MRVLISVDSVNVRGHVGVGSLRSGFDCLTSKLMIEIFNSLEF